MLKFQNLSSYDSIQLKFVFIQAIVSLNPSSIECWAIDFLRHGYRDYSDHKNNNTIHCDWNFKIETRIEL